MIIKAHESMNKQINHMIDLHNNKINFIELKRLNKEIVNARDDFYNMINTMYIFDVIDYETIQFAHKLLKDDNYCNKINELK